MVRLTKGLLDGTVIATTSKGESIEITRDIVVNQLQKYGCTLLEANKVIGDLLDGRIQEVKVGKEVTV